MEPMGYEKNNTYYGMVSVRLTCNKGFVKGYHKRFSSSGFLQGVGCCEDYYGWCLSGVG